jgi:hypothetical protein
MAEENRDRSSSIDENKYANLKKKTPIPNHLRPKKFSSTSSLYVDSTISAPNNAELMHCIAEFFLGLMKPASEISKETREAFEIFDETKHPLTDKKINTTDVPDVSTVESYIKAIFKIGQLAPESLVMAVAYLKRIESTSKFVLSTFTWRRAILECLILASKVWEDQAVWVVDFIDLFPLTTAHDLNLLEKKMLSLLGFDVSLKASDYAKIYFDLRAQSKSTGEHFLELRPLDKEGEVKLEQRTKEYSERNSRTLRDQLRTGSIEDLQGWKSPRVILS